MELVQEYQSRFELSPTSTGGQQIKIIIAPYDQWYRDQIGVVYPVRDSLGSYYVVCGPNNEQHTVHMDHAIRVDNEQIRDEELKIKVVQHYNLPSEEYSDSQCLERMWLLFDSCSWITDDADLLHIMHVLADWENETIEAGKAMEEVYSALNLQYEPIGDLYLLPEGGIS